LVNETITRGATLIGSAIPHRKAPPALGRVSSGRRPDLLSPRGFRSGTSRCLSPPRCRGTLPACDVPSL